MGGHERPTVAFCNNERPVMAFCNNELPTVDVCNNVARYSSWPGSFTFDRAIFQRIMSSLDSALSDTDAFNTQHIGTKRPPRRFALEDVHNQQPLADPHFSFDDFVSAAPALAGVLQRQLLQSQQNAAASAAGVAPKQKRRRMQHAVEGRAGQPVAAAAAAAAAAAVNEEHMTPTSEGPGPVLKKPRKPLSEEHRRAAAARMEKARLVRLENIKRRVSQPSPQPSPPKSLMPPPSTSPGFVSTVYRRKNGFIKCTDNFELFIFL